VTTPALAEDMLTAAEWLDVNEGTDGEAEACARIAARLRRQAEQMDEDHAARGIAKATGVTLHRARKAYRAARTKHEGGIHR
jgi:hypothetical protein